MTLLHDHGRAVGQPTLRTLRFDDYPAVARLEASQGLLTTPERDWRGFWLENPLWPTVGDQWPIGWALEHAGAIVGAVTNIPSRYVYQGRDLVAANGRAWVVAPAYRGFALWLLDEFFNQEGVDLFFNTTVNDQAAETFHVLGSKRVPLGDWAHAAFRITSHAGFTSSALRIKRVPLAGPLGYPAGAILRLKDATSTPPLPRPSAPGGVTFAWCREFDERFDAFWAGLVRENRSKLLGRRGRDDLAWHFAGPVRSGQVWIGLACRGGRIAAYGVFKRQDHAPSGLTRMRLVDHQTLEQEGGLLSVIVAAAARRCADERIGALEHVGVGLPKMRAFDRLAPYRRNLPAWSYYYKASDPTVREALERPETWDPSSFDGDASL